MILSWSTFLITILEIDTQVLLIKFAADRRRPGRAHLLEFEIRPFHFVLCSPQQKSPESQTLDSDGELVSSSKCRLEI